MYVCVCVSARARARARVYVYRTTLKTLVFLYPMQQSSLEDQPLDRRIMTFWCHNGIDVNDVINPCNVTIKARGRKYI